MRFFKMPSWLTNKFPKLTWQQHTTEKTIYLTFDDGPMQGVTEWVLDTLAEFGAKATFFCVGDNIRKNPDIFLRIVSEGHHVGNHTFNHLNGWANDFLVYLDNIQKCQRIIENTLKNEVENVLENKLTPEKKGFFLKIIENQKLKKPLFRPPYGKLSFEQIKFLAPKYQIIMWEVLTYDFDRTLSPLIALQRSIKYTQAGSIIVFHDSYKSFQQLQWILPRYLAHFTHLGYRFEVVV